MDDSGDQEIDGLYARLCHIEQYIPENNKDVYYGIHVSGLERCIHLVTLLCRMRYWK